MGGVLRNEWRSLPGFTLLYCGTTHFSTRNRTHPRIPATTLARYRIGDSVVMEERTDGILLRPRRAAGRKVSWEDTAAAMAAQPKEWSDWEATLADGLHEIPWEPAKAKRAPKT